MKNVTIDLGNPFIVGSPACSLSIIAREMQIKNRLAILDRLYEAGGLKRRPILRNWKNYRDLECKLF